MSESEDIADDEPINIIQNIELTSRFWGSNRIRKFQRIRRWWTAIKDAKPYEWSFVFFVSNVKFNNLTLFKNLNK